jgi:antitoxin ParD1/3/4
MGTFTVNLPDELRSFIESQVAERNLANAAEYVSSLIVADRAHAHLEELLLEGLNSGPPVETTPEFWQSLRDEISRRFPTQAAARDAAS